MRGKIIDTKGEPNAHKYKILGEDGIEYFAHVGDLFLNEQLVYTAGTNRDDLKIGESVDFEPLVRKPRAIHIKHIKS